MKTPKLLALLLISSLVFNLSCKKETETGPQGEKGDPGTANVMYSDWFQYLKSSATGDFSLYTMEIPVPRIDQEFINNGGSVLVYMGYAEDGKTDSVRQIKSLPTWGKEGYNNVPSTNDVYYDLGYVYEKDNLYINFVVTERLDKITDADYFFSNVFIGTNYYFRYILIPGGVNINNRVAAPVDYNDYEAVKAYYTIPE